MTKEELQKLKVLADKEAPPRYLLAKDKIRETLDPETQLISDEAILHILLISGGNIRRATHKCLLSIQQEARRQKNGALVIWTRNKLNLHESGLLLK